MTGTGVVPRTAGAARAGWSAAALVMVVLTACAGGNTASAEPELTDLTGRAEAPDSRVHTARQPEPATEPGAEPSAGRGTSRHAAAREPAGDATGTRQHQATDAPSGERPEDVVVPSDLGPSDVDRAAAQPVTSDSGALDEVRSPAVASAGARTNTAVTPPGPRAVSHGFAPAEVDLDDPGDDGEVIAELSEETVITEEGSAAAADDDLVTDLIWVAQPIHAAHPDGDNQGLCRGWRWIAADGEARATELREAGRAAYDAIWTELLAREAPGARRDLDCPTDPFDGVGAIALRDTVRSRVAGQLPRPEPSVPPGYALTGMPAYLDTGAGHALTYGRRLAVEVGPFTFDVEVSATGTSRIDWGDGSPTELHAEPGRPYPDGTIHHTYRHRGRVEVTVTDRWTIDFVATDAADASVSDTVEASLAPEALADLAVLGYRAVRISPDPPR